MFALSIIIVGVLTAVSVYVKIASALDKDTLCPKNEPYEHNVILVDKTDPWREVDVEKLKKLLSSLHQAVKMNTRLTIKVIHSADGGSAKVDVLFDLCNPGTKSDANPFYQNPEKFRIRYQSEFNEPFNKLTTTLTRPGKAPNTPLLDTLVSTINESAGDSTHLIVISDLFENGDKYNFYHHVPQAEEWIAPHKITKTRITVEVKYIDRQSSRERLKNEVRRQWKNYFNRLNINFHDETFMTVP